MFNLFRKKYIRSDWFEGLIAAQETMRDFGEDSCYINYYNEICRESEDYTEFAQGYFAYLCHYRNNLKKTENNACQD